MFPYRLISSRGASRMPLVALLYPEQCVIGQIILFILVGEMRTDVSEMVTGIAS
jgi:hypothetical protein